MSKKGEIPQAVQKLFGEMQQETEEQKTQAEAEEILAAANKRVFDAATKFVKQYGKVRTNAEAVRNPMAPRDPDFIGGVTMENVSRLVTPEIDLDYDEQPVKIYALSGSRIFVTYPQEVSIKAIMPGKKGKPEYQTLFCLKSYESTNRKKEPVTMQDLSQAQSIITYMTQALQK